MRGQASVEMALALLFGVVPLTLGLIAFAEAAWTYHGLTTITRLGARYAATHCFEDSSGQNVVSWLTDLNNPAAGFSGSATISRRRYTDHRAILDA